MERDGTLHSERSGDGVDSVMKWVTAVLVGFGFVWASAAQAQSRETDLAFQAVPFREWLSEGPKAQLPWRARIFAPELSQHQRIWVRIQIEVDGNELLKKCCDGRSVALVEITDQQGRAYRNYAARDLKEVKPGLSQYTVTLSWTVFVLPGDYQVCRDLLVGRGVGP